jgi:uncharacterized membrane protein YdjX (TVP38/TMEM64 family)
MILRPGRNRFLSLFIILGSVGTFAAAVYFFREEILSFLAAPGNFTIAGAADLIRSWGIWAPVVSLLLMLLQAVVAPLPSFAVTAANGMVFGPLWGGLLSWIGALGGAATSFYIGRLFRKKAADELLAKRDLRGYVERISGKYGFRVLIIARLVPFISFDFISYAAGLSYISGSSFLLATGLGMIPGTILYTLAGVELKTLDYSARTMTTLAAVIIVIFLMRSLYKKVHPNKRHD